MTKDILKDKFLGPILITLFSGIIYVKKTNDWIFLMIFLIIIIAILGLIFYFRNDYYIHNFSSNNDSFNIQYQKNFSKNKVSTFSLDFKSIDSISFNSKPSLGSFHCISIKYVNEDDGLYDKKTFKTNNDDVFINMLSEIRKTA